MVEIEQEQRAVEQSAAGHGARLLLQDAMKRREQGGVAFELHVPNLELAPGEFVAIVGESGCGKSTLLDMLALVSRPTRCGAFHYHRPSDGARVPLKQLWESGNEAALAVIRRSELGYVLQTGGLLPFLTVRQNIGLSGQLNGRTDAQELQDIAQRLGVHRLLDKKPQYLSGGQRQRVAIARALHHRPRLILADEPTAAVDRQRATEIVRDFQELAQETGATVAMVTHDRNLIAPYARRTFSFSVEEVSATLTRSQLYVETLGTQPLERRT